MRCSVFLLTFLLLPGLGFSAMLNQAGDGMKNIPSPGSPEVVPPGPEAVRSQELSESDQALVEQSFGQLPLYFIENQGQMAEEVDYYVKGADKTLYFTPQGVTFLLHGAAPSAPSVIASETKQSPAIESWGLLRPRLAMTQDAADAQPLDALELAGPSAASAIDVVPAMSVVLR